MKFTNKVYIFIILIPVCSIVSFIIGYNFKEEKDVSDEIVIAKNDNKETEVETKYIYVDVKGEVKKPGVYKMNENEIVNDAIKKAGGLKKTSYTRNINLSKKLSNEMVVYVFSNSEIKALKKKNVDTNDIKDTICTTEVIEVNNCPNIIEPTTESTSKTTSTTSKVENDSNKLVNINTASKEELMSINGIGESKANAIIEYRSMHKFEKIEDLKNVSGIGDSLYEKVKQYIKV